MQELRSKDEDCFLLYKLLKGKMGNRIEYYGTPYTDLFHGEYFSNYKEARRGLPFYYKFCKNGFLRIQVGNSIYHHASVGEKLAALSDFYQALNEEFGEPTAFYTTKNDNDGILSMHWSFINKEEDIKKFKEGTFFDDATTDKLIIIGESTKETNLNDITKKLISSQIGIPFELIPLVDENIEDFVKFKTGKELSVPENAKVDGVKITSVDKELTLVRRKKN